jgi:flagellar biosynthesis protein FliQ
MPLYLQLLHTALSTELSAILPILLILLFVGLATGIFQAAFQIEDTAFSLIPKIIIMIGLPLFGGLSVMHAFETLATGWISHAGEIVRQSWS